MTSELILEQETKQLLEDPLLFGSNTDSKIRHLLEAEYLRRAAHYRRVDISLINKYGMNFDEFLNSHSPEKYGNNWDVEKDALDWETAVSGIETMKRKLQGSGIEQILIDHNLL